MNIALPTVDQLMAKSIFDISVKALGWQDALSFAANAAYAPAGQVIISFLNAHNSNLAMRDKKYHAVLQKHVVFPDGVGVDIAARVQSGKVFPANLNGTDFVPALVSFAESPLTIAMIGAKEEVLHDARIAFETRAPWHRFVPISNGYFKAEDSGRIVQQIEELKPDLILVAMGTPYQELWIDQHIKPEHAKLVVSVGALFDFMAGVVPRAPEWMRRGRIEWIFRLMMEPGRLWRRYVVGNPLFLFHIARHQLLRFWR